MAGYYEQHDKLYVAVDCIIFGLDGDRVSVLLTHRRFEPEKGKDSLFGGFVRKGESIDAAAERVLTDLTGLTDIYMEQVGAFGDVSRDPGERVVSVAYFALVKFDEVDPDLIAAHETRWVSLDELPPLGFDHNEMIDRALFSLRRKFSNEPIVFRLLPELFTLTQMQNLYEAVMGFSTDKRNFRKRVLEMPFIVPTDLIDKAGSRRGARMYRFDENLYKKKPHFKLL